MQSGPILIIDDCRLTRAIATDLLAEAGYQVQGAASAIEANPLIEAVPGPALILMDVVMPMLSGDRKVRRMKAREISRAIPIVLVSTKSRSELCALAEASGADAFLQKPLNRNELLATVRRLLPGT